MKDIKNYIQKTNTIYKVKFNLHKLNLYLLDNKHITKTVFEILEVKNNTRLDWYFNLYFYKDNKISENESFYMYLYINSYFYDVKSLYVTNFMSYCEEDLELEIPSHIVINFFD